MKIPFHALLVFTLGYDFINSRTMWVSSLLLSTLKLKSGNAARYNSMSVQPYIKTYLLYQTILCTNHICSWLETF